MDQVFCVIQLSFSKCEAIWEPQNGATGLSLVTFEVSYSDSEQLLESMFPWFQGNFQSLFFILGVQCLIHIKLPSIMDQKFRLLMASSRKKKPHMGSRTISLVNSSAIAQILNCRTL